MFNWQIIFVNLSKQCHKHCYEVDLGEQYYVGDEERSCSLFSCIKGNLVTGGLVYLLNDLASSYGLFKANM